MGMVLQLVKHGLSQDLEAGRSIFQGRQQHTKITTINMYLIIEIRLNILKQCLGNYIEVKIFNNMFEIDIFGNSSQIFLGVLEGNF